MSKWLVSVLVALSVAGAAFAAKQTPDQRIAGAKKLLTQAAAAAKNAGVKKEIAAAQALLTRRQLQPAKVKVEELTRTAALQGESSAVVTRLIDAQDAISDALRPRGQKKGAKQKKDASRRK